MVNIQHYLKSTPQTPQSPQAENLDDRDDQSLLLTNSEWYEDYEGNQTIDALDNIVFPFMRKLDKVFNTLDAFIITGEKTYFVFVVKR